MPNKKKKVTTPSVKKTSKPKAKRTTAATEPDSVYFLKIVFYVILGTLWLKFGSPLSIGDLTLQAIPLGLIIGVIAIRQDRFQIDRKIEYAILVVVTIMSYFLPAGIII